MKETINIPASIRQRLLNRARTDQRPFNELLQYFAMERFLYRLSQSAHAQRFVLKGALMLRIWRCLELRPTMDIDMLGRTGNDVESVIAQIRDILSITVEPDGLVFDIGSIQAERITEDADYEGIRIRFFANLDTAKINMQVDIGFGDVIYPKPVKAELPTMLNLPAPLLICYSRESSIAEKLEAMVKLEMLNSRMKDFYDIWLLSRQFDFEGIKISEAIRQTFKQRGTTIPTVIEAFTAPFIEAKQTQWMAFVKRLERHHIPASFSEVVTKVDEFIAPIVSSISTGKSVPTYWKAPGPWH